MINLLFIHFLVVVGLTVAVSWLVLRRYARAVLLGMQVAGSSSPAMAPSARPARGDPLSISEFEIPAAHTIGARLALQDQRRAAWRVAFAYSVSTAACGVLLTSASLWSNEIEISTSRVLGIGGVIASAAVPMIAITLAVPFWRATVLWGLAILGVSVLSVVAPIAIHAVRGDEFDPSIALNAIYTFQLAAVYLGFPFLLAFATGTRKLRGVAPLSLGLISILALVPLLGTKATGLLAASPNGVISSLNVVGGMYLSFFLLAPLAGWVTWRVLILIARAYEAKRFSDSQLIANSWWLIIVATLIPGIESGARGVGGMVSFCAAASVCLLFATLSHYLLRRARSGAVDSRRPMLLLLRVFGRTSASERFFDRVIGRWRLTGPVSVIAAPDIVTRTVDPSDFLRFVRGQVAETFISSQAVLEERLSTLDSSPDPDGRYRINEFWCRSDTWQPTAVRLMQLCDVVVADVRGLAPGRLGMQFELEQLAARVSAERIVLVIDESTDIELIRGAMVTGRGELKLVRIRNSSLSETKKVLDALLVAAHSAT